MAAEGFDAEFARGELADAEFGRGVAEAAAEAGAGGGAGVRLRQAGIGFRGVEAGGCSYSARSGEAPQEESGDHGCCL